MALDSSVPDPAPAPGNASAQLIQILCIFGGIIALCMLLLSAILWRDRRQERRRLNDRRNPNIDGTGGAIHPGIELQRPQRALRRRASDTGTPTPTYGESVHDVDMPYNARTEMRDGKLYAVDHEGPPSYEAPHSGR